MTWMQTAKSNSLDTCRAHEAICSLSISSTRTTMLQNILVRKDDAVGGVLQRQSRAQREGQLHLNQSGQAMPGMHQDWFAQHFTRCCTHAHHHGTCKHTTPGAGKTHGSHLIQTLTPGCHAVNTGTALHHTSPLAMPVLDPPADSHLHFRLFTAQVASAGLAASVKSPQHQSAAAPSS